MNIELKTQILKSGKPQVAIAREIGITEPKLSRIVRGWDSGPQKLKIFSEGELRKYLEL